MVETRRPMTIPRQCQRSSGPVLRMRDRSRGGGASAAGWANGGQAGMLVRAGNRRSAALLIVVAAFALAGCQPSVDVSRVTVDRHLPPALEVEIQLVTDEDGRSIVPDAIQGKQVFEANCAVCHGATGNGNGPMAVTLKAPEIDPLTALLG